MQILKKSFILLVLMNTLLVGCRPSAAPNFPEFANNPVPYTIQNSSSNGFDDYCRAANDAGQDDPLGYARVSYTEGQKLDSLKKLGKAMASLKKGSDKSFEFKFVPSRPLEPHPFLGGWRLLSRAVLWKIEQALETNSIEDLVVNIKLAAKFSSNMLQGGAAEANLGITLTDEVRKLLAPRIPEMNAAMLDMIAETYTPLAMRENWIEDVIPNEKEQMKQSVQFLQDNYQQKQWKLLNEQLGAEARDAVTYLEQMSRKDGSDRVNYFQGFSAEIETEEKIIQDALSISPALRFDLPVPTGERPWKRFSKTFFRSLRPVLVGADRSRTRTRLLVLECRLWALSSRNRSVPRNLTGFNKVLRTDPYSGQDFGYEAFEAEFRLYSVGTDQRDNGGKTNEEFLVPDVRIERL